MQASEPRLRFAPSPNGCLHLGHAYSALLNARIARTLGGKLLLRIEDIDLGRARPEFVAGILADLDWLGLRFDGPIRRQSEHFADYAAARDALAERDLIYPCFCSRGQIAAEVAARQARGAPVSRDPDGAPLYPGTCRALSADARRARIGQGEPHTWRLDMPAALRTLANPLLIRRFSPDDGAEETVSADPARWGDAVIVRRDVPTSYHLSVVCDDAVQGITHVVRGQDLEAATDLHALLQRLLHCPMPAYHHHGLIRAEDGEKLAKSKGSESLADLRARGVTAEDVRARLGFSRLC
ncbi:tRNA glutamyl-Q(34) synthetase GluQRS [Methylorubrum extorquens]|uniref:Glutamyl-tRNA synthetase class Ic n=1 Tax=Methylorubrum extorquens (strain CM4 / NCIMB 13688) TaxID=440085 RepID=B7KPF7_METC4|nr:tRNA glutamyl-Q(34) synthetase GluQRS [Methylorubrum extorquens]ACK82040.1 glutamyl-tRNA synthetase class Ic [Methylorubrum extorquens CM4]